MTTVDRPPPALLDVNVLVALAWPNHEGHVAARTWFLEESGRGWATTPVTELGFVRISSNRVVMPTATTPARAIDLLGRLTARPGHRFWPDPVPMVTGRSGGQPQGPSELRGHRQVTDAHLLALCVHHGGRLATFDRAVLDLAGADDALVHLLRAEAGL
ncbi:MAG TPA: TA system VapC family ribonuclease toxin [Actinomycetospora sp.]|nr:TA system VapC family ribonuclease toxin [Actinomycetospora sp.]